jgi:hypothetical protein
MGHIVQRFGFRITRGWATLIVAVGVLVATAFWIGPFRPLPAELRLVALGGDGQFRAVAGIPRAWADTSSLQSDVPARFPLVLAVHNEGARAIAPRQLALSVPARFRLTDSRGQPFDARPTAGNPLIRYTFDMSPTAVAPGQLPRLLSDLDTVWLEPIVPSYYCSALSDSVPEFLPAPPQDPNTLAMVRIFYSFDARSRDRQTGLLTIQLDPALLDRKPAPQPPTFPTTIRTPEAVRPVLPEITQVGSRTSWCGDPGSALELYDVLWETPEGGRMFVLYYGGSPRKYLYDLNRDSIIELEVWDSDSDGKFEASRPARMPIPEFLMPPKPLVMLAGATDSTGAVMREVGAITMDFPASVFHDTDAGPLRFWRALPAERRARIDSIAASLAAESARREAPATTAPAAAAPTTPAPAPTTPTTSPQPAAPPPAAAPARPAIRVDLQYPRATFHNTDAGPLRFWRALQRSRGLPTGGTPGRGGNTPRVLGTPVARPDSARIDSLRRSLRRDTLLIEREQE